MAAFQFLQHNGTAWKHAREMSAGHEGLHNLRFDSMSGCFFFFGVCVFCTWGCYQWVRRPPSGRFAFAALPAAWMPL